MRDLAFKVIRRLLPRLPEGRRRIFCQDGLITDHDSSFTRDPGFLRQRAAGLEAHGSLVQVDWRLLTVLWASDRAVQLGGAIVECGTERGRMMRSVLERHRDVRMFLFDAWSEAVLRGVHYVDCYEDVQRTFASFPNVRLVRGRVPESFAGVDTGPVAFLHVDMNDEVPEMAALAQFWPLLQTGAVVIGDDYGQAGYEPQRDAWNRFARDHEAPLLCLPTGQALVIKP